MVDNDPVSKKIKTALRDLIDALEKHAAVTAERPTSSKRAGRATAKVRSAAASYTAIVAAKTGQPNPFVDFLDDETVASLRAERDAVARKHDDKRSASGETGRGERADEKKSDSKKSDGKKSDSKKSDGRKSDSKKSDSKKSDAKKSDDEKSDKKKSDEKSKKSDEKRSGADSDSGATSAAASKSLPPAVSSPPSSLFVPPLPHAVTVDEGVADDTETDPARDLTAMTLVQLRELAREAGLSGVSRATKATLIDHLHQGATR